MYDNSGWSIPTTLGMVRYLLVFSGELIGVIAGTKNVAKQLRHIISVPVRSVQGIGRGSLNFLIRVCTFWTY